MDHSPEAIGEDVVISLSRKEGRKAKLACMKEKNGDEKFSHIREAEEEFSRAFNTDDANYYESTSFVMSTRAASAASRAIEINESKSLASKVRYQVTMQGVVID